MTIEQRIKQKATDIGFDLVGITTATPISKEDIDRFAHWLNTGCAADMDYMHNNFDKRTNPANLLKNAKSVICTALNYKPAHRPDIKQNDQNFGRIANYAMYIDYHTFIKDMLFQLADFIKQTAGVPVKFKPCVDSVPLAERALAQRAGIGFIGRNAMLKNPDLGSQLLLGELITTLELTPDKPMHGHCPGCDKCIQACPTKAFSQHGVLDCKKCISYLTMEHKGDIDTRSRAAIKDKLFGCQECVLACPFEKNGPVRKNSRFTYLKHLEEISLEQILQWNQNDFDTALKNTPIHRLGLANLKRNAAICLENIKKAD